jgi:hypothetical protein
MKYVASAHDVICEHILRPSQEKLEDGDVSCMGVFDAETGAGVTRFVYWE